MREPTPDYRLREPTLVEAILNDEMIIFILICVRKKSGRVRKKSGHVRKKNGHFN